ncbi:MAG: hypothetical protein NUV63_12270 [Gallionella sp.]|nr:hypothetical protein [Gallionella sp.]
MTDLEITRLCAAAMGYTIMSEATARSSDPSAVLVNETITVFRPLHDDAQVMVLVKKHNLSISRGGQATNQPWWGVSSPTQRRKSHSDLNRAICECVAKMQSAK